MAIPFGRAAITAVVFFPAFVSVVMTHRFKLRDGQTPLSTLNVPYESVRIPSADGLVLDGWFIPGSPPRGSAGRSHNGSVRISDRTIVICHGAGANKGNFVWFLGPLLYRGYNVLFFDFRAHGSSDGRTCTYGLLEKADVRAAIDWLKRERPAQSHTIVGLGSSQGAMALALAAAEDRRINAVILDSPFTSPRDLAMHHAQSIPLIGPAFVGLVLWEMSLQTGADFVHESALPAVAALAPRPLLVIHGDRDAIMPGSHAQRLYEAARGPREIWFGPGPHSNIVTSDPEGYADHVFSFLNRHVK